ncbi:MAG TPA: FecR family protein, partial [Terriglobales bacterium]|nr:FecR family protein [Terriglobales bacterium]
MAAHATPIANVDEVVNDATHIPPGATIEPVKKSDGLVQNEQVQTQPQSAVQMTFVDGSALRLEESSTVVLDNYVFDPKAQAANGLVNLGAGLFRFTSSGKDDQGVILKTAAATIGIRGTDIVINVQQKGVTRVDVMDGKVFMKPLGYGAGAMVEAGQSGLVLDGNTNVEVGDIGSFATAAGGPTSTNNQSNDHNGTPGGERTGKTSPGNTGSSG